MRVCLLAVLLSNCTDIIEHGSPVVLAINLLDCDRVTVAAGATDLRLTARAAGTVVYSRTVKIEQLPRTISIDESADVVLQVDALDATGNLLARGISRHFAAPSEDPIAVDLHTVGRFSRVCGSLVTARAFHSATLLPDGRTLVVGGRDSSGVVLASMEVVSSNEVRDVGPLAVSAQGNTFVLPRERHAAALLSNGQVVISGGEDRTPLASILVVDPSSGFQIGAVGPSPSPPSLRSRHLALAVSDGVVFIGGITRTVQIVANPAVERLPLATMHVESIGSLPQARLEAALGRVGSVAIVAGGLESDAVSNKLDLVSIDQGGITRQLALSTARRGARIVTHGNRALLLGGFDADGVALTSTEWINVDPPGWSVIAGPPIAGRGESCAVALTLGRTLILGSSRAPELLNADGSIETVAFSGAAATGQSCTLAEDGSVLVIGGLDASGRAVDEVWRYQPTE